MICFDLDEQFCGDQRKRRALPRSLQREQEAATHGMCRVEGDKHATRELNVSADNYKGLRGLFVSGK